VARFDRILLLLTWIACIALTAAALVAVRHAAGHPRVAWGIALFWAGIAAWLWGRSAWRADFAQLARVPAALVTRGPYRVVRHPLYLSTAIAAGGQAVAAGTRLAAGLWIGLAMVLVVRAWREERLLRGAFGSAWDAYARHSLGISRTRE
jgi:protein-S-isoprenylcysteine O-methyltransferase Ste14